MSEVYENKLPHGWGGGVAVTKWWRGKFVHLYRLQKPCAQCNTNMTIDVTREALRGDKKNSGLLLKRCAGCRNISRADVGRSRPHVAGQQVRPAVSVDPEMNLRIVELEKMLKEAEETVAAVAEQAGGVRKAIHEELGLSLMGDGITYATVKSALTKLKGTYELSSALKLASENKMPWQ